MSRLTKQYYMDRCNRLDAEVIVLSRRVGELEKLITAYERRGGSIEDATNAMSQAVTAMAHVLTDIDRLTRR